MKNPQFSVSRIVRRTESVATFSFFYADPAVPASHKLSIKYRKKSRDRDRLRTGTLLNILFGSLAVWIDSSPVRMSDFLYLLYLSSESFSGPNTKKSLTVKSSIYLLIPLMGAFGRGGPSVLVMVC